MDVKGPRHPYASSKAVRIRCLSELASRTLGMATALPAPYSNFTGETMSIGRGYILLLRVFLLAAALCAACNPAWAHAIIVESTPKINDVVTGPVLQIKLRFNVRVDSARSKLTLILPDGNSREVAIPKQVSPDSISATILKILPGSYHLHWQVLAGDGHITQGDIPFTVTPP
jgi:copper resistance protein C